MKQLLLIIICAGLISFVHAQKQVTGIVTDAKDSTPLSGASIKVKGSTKGTLSDANGEFRISVPSNAVLEISSVGYVNKDVPVGAQSSLLNFQVTYTAWEN